MKVLQADDHELFRDGARYILAKLTEQALQLVESHDFVSTVSQMDENPDLDLALLDLDMPGMHGTEGLRKIIERFPTTHHPTRRQLEILSCMAEGMPNKAIANRLFLAESTIKGHVRGLLQTFEVSNRVQAINKARELGHLSR